MRVVSFVMTAISLVQRVKNLPPVSQAALKLISLLDQSSVDNDDIVRVLKYDNVLTAKLLRSCNAPSFGLQDSVESVDQAVLILGHQQILHIVMTLAFGSVVTVSSLAYTMEAGELWEHSIVAATAAEIALAEFPRLGSNANVAFTASLLHDIGKLVLGHALTAAELGEIRDRTARKEISCWEAEREVLGVDHADVGAALLQNWRLPQSIVEAVGDHHRPVVQPEPQLSALVHVANVIAHHAHPPPGQNLHDLRIAEALVTRHSHDEKKLESMVESAKQSFERVERFMAME